MSESLHVCRKTAEWVINMNIIIVGCGKIGQKLAEYLSLENDNNITVVDTRAQRVSEMTSRLDMIGIEGSGANIDTLLEAGVEDADLLIAVTGSDEINLLTCFLARKSADCRTIARVRKPEYNKEIGLFREDLGLTMIINPEQAAADEMARILRFPSAIRIDTFAKGKVEILKFKVPSDCCVNNVRISDLHQKLKCDILVCGVEREEKVFIPGGDFVLKSGDIVSIVASPENGAEFFKKIGVKTNRVRNTIIVGGGAISYYLAKNLISNGISVKIIEKDPNRCEQLLSLLPKAVVICGDGTDTRLLTEEGIETCESFVSLTNIDEENILLTLFAKSRSNAKCITKVNRISFDDVIGSLDLDSVIYPKDITAERILKYVRAKKNSIGSNIETIHFILNGKAEALEFHINENSSIVNKRIEQLDIKDNTLIACISRDSKVFLPRGNDEIKSGDSVIVVTAHMGCQDISDIIV